MPLSAASLQHAQLLLPCGAHLILPQELRSQAAALASAHARLQTPAARKAAPRTLGNTESRDAILHTFAVALSLSNADSPEAAAEAASQHGVSLTILAADKRRKRKRKHKSKHSHKQDRHHDSSSEDERCGQGGGFKIELCVGAMAHQDTIASLAGLKQSVLDLFLSHLAGLPQRSAA